MLSIFSVLYILLTVTILLNRYLGDCFFSLLKIAEGAKLHASRAFIPCVADVPTCFMCSLVVKKLGILVHFTPWGIGLRVINTFLTVSSLSMLNCFKNFLIYILRQNVSKSEKKDFELYQVSTHNCLC